MTEPKLESYLGALDEALGQIPVSDRADIIIEIKSHVLDAQSRNPNQNLDDILQSLGDPETVAKRYLQERGIQAAKPAPVKSQASMMWVASTVKWLVIGCVSILGLLILTVALIIWRFTPLVSVDDTQNKVSLGGGIINVTGEKKDSSSVPGVPVIDKKPKPLPAPQP